MLPLKFILGIVFIIVSIFLYLTKNGFAYLIAIILDAISIELIFTAEF
ncbi:hypothetical protein J4223_00560 [Candidatus Woesearchaeota archaeon]|nr:hypothetical protein [Candidatus Woesearchaeota archaeon]